MRNFLGVGGHLDAVTDLWGNVVWCGTGCGPTRIWTHTPSGPLHTAARYLGQDDGKQQMLTTWPHVFCTSRSITYTWDAKGVCVCFRNALPYLCLASGDEPVFVLCLMAVRWLCAVRPDCTLDEQQQKQCWNTDGWVLPQVEVMILLHVKTKHVWTCYCVLMKTEPN